MAAFFHSRPVFSASFYDFVRTAAPRPLCRTLLHKRPSTRASEQCHFFGIGAIRHQRSSQARQSSSAAIASDPFSSDDLHIPFDQLEISHPNAGDTFVPASNQHPSPLPTLQEANSDVLLTDSTFDHRSHDAGILIAGCWNGRHATSGFEAELAIIDSMEESSRSRTDSIHTLNTQSFGDPERPRSKESKRGIKSTPSRRIRALRLEKFRERTSRGEMGGIGDAAETERKPMKKLITKDTPRRLEKEKWQIDKTAFREKFRGEAWNPKRRLSPDALEGIRTLHAQHPEEFTTPVLAEHFKVSPEAVRRILRSKWRPSNDEEEARRERWDKRGEKIWTTLVDQGVHPPKKWREMGIGGGPRRVAQGTSDHGQRRRREGASVVHEDQAAPQLSSSSAWIRSLAKRLA